MEEKTVIEKFSNESEKEVKEKFLKVFLLAILSGMFIAIGGFASTIASYTVENTSIRTLLAGIIFPIGLILVTICGANLFTGKCLYITGVLDKKIKILSLLKYLGIVFLGNLAGSILFAVLIYFAKVYSNPDLINWTINIANTKSNIPAITATINGVICNIIVCLAVYGAKGLKERNG